MDHCFPSDRTSRFTGYIDGSKTVNEVNVTRIMFKSYNEGWDDPNAGGRLTSWLCSLLTSNYSSECTKKKKEWEDQTNCQACEKLKAIIENTNSTYIPFKSLYPHYDHLPDMIKKHLNIYTPRNSENFILAYYNEEGVQYKLFPVDYMNRDGYRWKELIRGIFLYT